ncbi:MAG TPA: septal ring lytic transglycosylase RlpA family protein [Xanthobacteraceae bacterium]|nr:septal ring lytic transglycosylase RlpA family protein [Xanthobacteraceae bacterium]
MGYSLQGEGVACGVRIAVLALCGLTLAQCSSSYSKYGVSPSARVVADGEPVPKGGGVYRVGKPYVIAGRTYVPQEDKHYHAEGVASWYGDDFHGRLTANGEVFDMNSISAAHPTLPMPSYVRVTNLTNGRSLVVRVNDRGPYANDRVIDVSVKAAKLLGFYDRGLTRVSVEYVGPAPLEGSDDRQLVATLRQGGPAPAPSLVRVAAAQPFLPQAPKETATNPPSRRLALTEADMPPAAKTKYAAAQPPRQRDIEVANLPEIGSTSGAAAASPAISVGGGSAVSGFAPTGYDAPAAFLSGRGLY